MDRLTDDFILERIGKARPKDFEPQFSLNDLVGKTIKEHRQIEYKQVRETRMEDYDDPQFSFIYSPKKFDVITFTDGTFLATEVRADGEFGHLCCYYNNGNRTLYSGELFGLV